MKFFFSFQKQKSYESSYIFFVVRNYLRVNNKNCVFFVRGAQISEFGFDTTQQKLVFCFTQRQMVKNDNQKSTQNGEKKKKKIKEKNQ